MLWRRSYDTPPPPLPDDEPGETGDTRYANLLEAVPRTPSLKDFVERILPYWYDVLVPDLRTYDVVLIVAHGNSAGDVPGSRGRRRRDRSVANQGKS